MNGVCWYYDAAALVLLVLFIIQGVKKGFSKTVIHFALNLVFVVLAFLMSGIMTDMVYDGYFRSTVSESVESSLENFDVNSELKKVYSELTLIGEVSDTKISAVLSSEKNMDEKFQKLIVSTSGIGSQIDESKIFEGLNSIVKFRLHEKLSEKIPSCAGKYFSSLDESNKEETYKILNLLASDKKEAADYIMENYIDSTLYGFVQIMMFLISAFVLMIFTAILLAVMFREKDMISNGRGDSAGGAVLSVINWGIAMLMLAFVIKVIIYSGVQIEGFLDDNTLNNTIAFRYLYNADALFIKK